LTSLPDLLAAAGDPRPRPDFLFAISLTSSDASRTVPAALAFFTGESSFTQPTGSISAAAVVVTVPIIVFVLIFQRRIVSGLTAGAVKG
jgi:multiple sugar transport system permease protein